MNPTHEHVCCGFTAATIEEVHAHMKGCPEILKFRNQPPTIVEAFGMRIIAGHPDALRQYRADHPNETGAA